MIVARRGQSSPRVVALQILLNRRKLDGDPLGVDGVYGPKTAAAVLTFREKVLRMSGSGDVADGDVFGPLLAGAGLCVVDALDVTDPDVLGDGQVLGAQGSRLVQTGAMSNGVGQVVADVARRASGHRSVVLLRFHGHGAPGRMGVSIGTRQMWKDAGIAVDPSKERSLLDLDVVKAASAELEKLRPYFADFGSAELHGCKVGQDTKILSALASLWGVPVSASTEQQVGGDEALEFEGKVRTVFPGGGSLRGWAKSRAEALVPAGPR